MRHLFFLAVLITIQLSQYVFVTEAHAQDVSNREIAARIFQRLAGVPLTPKDARLAQMEAFVAKGDYLSAAAIATEDRNFFNVTVKNWAAVMANRDETPYVPLDDFQALLIGATRDGMDARTLLSSNIAYIGDTNIYGQITLNSNNHYQAMENARADLKASLKQSTQVGVPAEVASGLLTTRAWAQAHYNAGTNRRGVEFTFREFLCTPIAVWKDTGLPDKRVRQDVDRAPGQNPKTYQTQCRSCHSGMDGMAGALSRLDFANNTFTILPVGFVAPKFRQNANIYPEGYKTSDDSWINFSTKNHNVAFGWKNVKADQTITGKGVREFGTMIANADAFKTCMAKKVFKAVCLRADGSGDASMINSVSNRFESQNFNLKKLFQDVAVLPGCAGVQ